MTDVTVKRNIYFVWNYLSWGGAQIYFLGIIKVLKDKWNVKVVLPEGFSKDLLSFFSETGVEFEFLRFSIDEQPAFSIGAKIKRQFRRIRSELEIFNFFRKRDLRNNILHIELAPWQSWVLITALSTRRANIFLTLHNFLPKSSKMREFIWKLRLQFVSRLSRVHIFASNQDTKERLKGWVAPNLWKSIQVTYTSVNPVLIESVNNSRIDTANLREQLKLPREKFIVLCVGQFIDRKGRWIFLEAAEKVLEQTDDIAFVWVMPTLPNISDRGLLARYKVNNAFFPILSRDVGTERFDILAFFKIANVFALPSFVEGLPIALLEAMALRIPSISTNVYAIPEAVKNRQTGLLIEAGNSNALAGAILNLYSDKHLRNDLSSAGSDFVLKHFDERESAHIAAKTYNECFNDGR